MAQPQKDRLSEALLNAFDENSFESLLFGNLNKRVFDVIPYQDFVSQVTRAAAKDGWTGDLINAALKGNPRNSLLLEEALFDPLRRLMVEPSNTTSASGGEVGRGLRALIEMLNHTQLDKAQLLFGEIHNHLTDLYGEYQKHAAATTAEE